MTRTFYSNIILLTSLIILLFNSNNGSSQESHNEFSIKIANFNSPKVENSSLYINDDIVYSSDKEEVGLFTHYNTNTGRSFFDFYSTSQENKLQNLITKINSKFHDAAISTNKDFDIVFFTRSSPNKVISGDTFVNKLNIYYLFYKNEEWSQIHDFPLNDPKYSFMHPSLSYDEKYLYFASDFENKSKHSDIYRIPFLEDNTWGEPELLSSDINSKDNEIFPFIHKDNVLYYASDVSKDSLNKYNIYRAFPSKKSFSKPEKLPYPINSNYDDYAFSASIFPQTAGKGLFTSTRPSGKGMDDIYLWERTSKPFKLVLKVVDKKGNKLPKSKIKITDKKSNIHKYNVNFNAKKEINLFKNKDYIVSVNNSNFSKKSFKINVNKDTQLIIKKTISLDKALKLKTIPINKSNEIINNVNVKVSVNNKTFNFISNKQGIDTLLKGINLSDIKDINLEYSKKGYKKFKIKSINKFITDSEIIIPRNKSVLHKISEDLKPEYIVFRYNNFSLTDNAMTKLDSIISLFRNKFNNDYLKIESHTDCRGSNYYNMNLSEKRSKSIIKYLYSKSITKSRIAFQNYGEDNQFVECNPCENCNKKQYRKNRRSKISLKSNNKIEVSEFDKIYFNFNQSSLTSKAITKLDSLASYINNNSSINLNIIGHTDCRGNKQYNEQLSEKRAHSIKNYLKGKNIASKRLNTMALGEYDSSNNLTPCNSRSETKHAKDRYVKIHTIKIE